ncbi:LysR family transcriptional regulator [Paraburkholderia sp.]|uniref:LysR family transcriptional regulator n=1 Tax=Paraburkholderia sp. TaxID=1926495 RepID=UPI00238B221A|nr:LysR family transcriptional regulator [Paraburkholderia sp.]MDE1179861.1 LysR family transcriptional regulator [Paraburkholderia sp.]
MSHVVALAEEGSFARAAERVHLSQPALSRSIQTIEDELGVRLFDRAARGVAVTQVGKLIVERARRVLFESSCLLRDVELLKTHEAGEVRIGLGPYPAVVLLPDMLIEFSRRHPKVEIKLELNHSRDMIERLLADKLDFLVIDRRVLPDNPALAVQSLRRHDGGWYVRNGHPLLSRESVAVDELRAFPFVSVPLPPFMRSALHRLLAVRSHEKIPVQLQCSDVRTLKSYVEHTDALLFATHSSVHNELAAGTLKPLAVQNGPRMCLELALVSLAERSVSPAGEAALALAEQLLNDANVRAVTPSSAVVR